MTDPFRSFPSLPPLPPLPPIPGFGPIAPQGDDLPAATGMAGDTMCLASSDAMPELPSPKPSGKYKDIEELAAKTRTDANTWVAGRPLSEGKNAHKTNTVDQMKEALKSDENFFECDLRPEIDPPHRPECRHDEGSESGDNLLLSEWLDIGKRSGRGLKLDIKDGGAIPQILDEVEKNGVPDERLMFNLQDADMAKYAPEIRRRFPLATVAINPASELDGHKNDGKMQDWQVDRMIQLAEQAGPPTTFVVRFDLLTDEAIARLKEHGTVSVWNAMGEPAVSDPAKVAQQLRDRGVDGVVDIRETPDLLDKVEVGVDYAKNKARDFFHDHF
ncbi:MAG: hypothetical protein JWM80_2707 [Cyanobacteria bacterium RYN_339]|nr:hypothetical protein [Cyanobacteria bacterium RYN_339]